MAVSDIDALARIDSFPYRHRLHEVMSAPVLTTSPDMLLSDAIPLMYENRVSSLVTVDSRGRTHGIFTERDLLRILSTAGASALSTPLREWVTHPVASVSGDAFVYVAIGKMTRLGHRHLVVVDSDNRPIGMITARALLKVRASEALSLGDSVHEASTAEDMQNIMSRLPDLARGLRAEGVSTANIGAVIGLAVRDLTARAVELSEAAMLSDGWGNAPAPYAFLVLGSAGRGESLLTFDQDNALVHRGTDADDVWFAELGKRVNILLNEAGIPFCDGGVMAQETRWRKSLEGWKAEIHDWVFSPENQTVMYCDIFFDFQPVWGDRDLAEELREYAMNKACESAFFMQYLAQHVAKMENPLGFFGGFTTKNGRLNIKKYALLPLVSAARLRAIRAHISATGTDERYTLLKDTGVIHDEDWRDFLRIREIATGSILGQQISDINDGIPPSANVDPKRLPRQDRERLRWAFKRLHTLRYICGISG